MGHWVEQRIRVTARRTCIAWLLVFGLVGLGYLANARYFMDFASGAFVASEGDLDAIHGLDSAPHQWVRVTGARAVDTGVQEVEVTTESGRETGRRVTASWYALEIGDRYLIVKGKGAKPVIAEGGLAPMPAEFSRHFFADPEMQKIRSEFYPFVLDTSEFRAPGYLALAATGALLVVFCIYGLRALRRWREPSAHPAARRMARWGDPTSTEMEIEREQSSPRFAAGGWRITENYLVKSSFFSFDLLRLEDLLWGYKTVTRHSVNFIPTGKTYKATLVCGDGKAEIGASQKAVDALLELAASRAPWAAFGYSKERESLMRKNPSAFAAAVAERRRDPALSRPPVAAPPS